MKEHNITRLLAGGLLTGALFTLFADCGSRDVRVEALRKARTSRDGRHSMGITRPALNAETMRKLGLPEDLRFDVCDWPPNNPGENWKIEVGLMREGNPKAIFPLCKLEEEGTSAAGYDWNNQDWTYTKVTARPDELGVIVENDSATHTEITKIDLVEAARVAMSTAWGSSVRRESSLELGPGNGLSGCNACELPVRPHVSASGPTAGSAAAEEAEPIGAHCTGWTDAMRECITTRIPTQSNFAALGYPKGLEAFSIDVYEMKQTIGGKKREGTLAPINQGEEVWASTLELGATISGKTVSLWQGDSSSPEVMGETCSPLQSKLVKARRDELGLEIRSSARMPSLSSVGEIFAGEENIDFYPLSSMLQQSLTRAKEGTKQPLQPSRGSR